VSKGKIGEVRMVKADFCFRSDWKPQEILLNPLLGLGRLLDVCVYSIALAYLFFEKEPANIRTLAHIGKTGVDEQAAMILGYEGDAMAILTCAVRTSTPHEALIVGTEGWIKIPPLFWQPNRIIVCRHGSEKELKFELLGNGYNYEAAEVMHCLRKGRLESAIMPWDKTLGIMRTMDLIRAQWGLKYPMEQP